MVYKQQKCIYCRDTVNSEGLSISDIIPYALTGEKLTNKFVCREHNAYTNKEFESDCIKMWDFFRSHLGFKTREGDLIKYKANIIIDGILIENVKLSDKKTFYTKQILSKNHKGHKVILGNSRLIKNKLKVEPEQLNNNNIKMQYNFSLKGLISSPKMKRTVAKIAYEWHCHKNDIEGCRKENDMIISYILDNYEEENIVECVVDKYTFYVADKLSEIGTNRIYEYTDKTGICYVIFNFWNVVIYKVKINQNNSPVIEKENEIQMELYNLDGTKDCRTFSIVSLEGGFDVISESCEKAINRLHDEYLKRIQRFLTHMPLTIYTLKKYADDLVYEISQLEKNKITIYDFLEYEESKKIILIQEMLLFSSEKNYNSDESFNSNIKKLLNSEEFFTVNDEQLKGYIQKIIDLYEKELLVGVLKKD